MTAKITVEADGVIVTAEADGVEVEGKDVLALWERVYDRVALQRATDGDRDRARRDPSAGTGFLLERGESTFNDKPNEGEGFL